MNVVVRPRHVAPASADHPAGATRTVEESIGPVGLVSSLLVVFLAGLLVLPPPIVAAVGVALLVAAVRARRSAPDRPALPRSSPVVVFAIVAVALWISAVAPFATQPLRSEGAVLLATFAVLPVAALAACQVPRHRHVAVVLWLAAAGGALIAGVSGLVEVAVLGARRADGTTRNAIVFGDLSLLMAMLAVALMPVVQSVSAANEHAAPLGRAVHRWRLLTVAAAVLGLLASIVSGSRGGWLAMPVMGAVLAVRYRRALRARSAARLAATFAVMTVVAVRLSGSMPLARARAAFDEVRAYDAAVSPLDPAAGTSIGARFEAWRAALWAASEHVLTGVGWGNLHQQYGELAWARYRNPRIARFDHAHQQLISAAANSGLPGLVAWCAVLAVPTWYFWRAAWHAPDVEQRSVGAAGLVVVFGFGVFGLTEAIFEQAVPLAFFAVVVGLLMSQIVPSPDRSDRRRPVQRLDARPSRAEVTGE